MNWVTYRDTDTVSDSRSPTFDWVIKIFTVSVPTLNCCSFISCLPAGRRKILSSVLSLSWSTRLEMSFLSKVISVNFLMRFPSSKTVACNSPASLVSLYEQFFKPVTGWLKQLNFSKSMLECATGPKRNSQPLDSTFKNTLVSIFSISCGGVGGNS